MRCAEFLMSQSLLRALRLRESTDETFCDGNFQGTRASEQRLNLLMMGVSRAVWRFGSTHRIVVEVLVVGRERHVKSRVGV